MGVNTDEIRGVKGFENLTKTEIISVMNFLVEIARLELKLMEMKSFS